MAEEIITSTIVERIQIFASPTAFCFILWIMPDTAMKCLGW